MSVAVSRRSPIRTLLLWAAPVTWLGCGGGGGTDVVLPSLSVTTTTEGVELDADGYSLVVDGGSGQPIGPAATVTIERLDEGQHTLELSGLAANCQTEGANPRTVTTRTGATASSEFAVLCGPTTGTIGVTTATSGTVIDPDGYALGLDGGPGQPLGVNASLSLANVVAGEHSLLLTGLATNCTVSGANPQTVSVPAGGTVTAEFTVSCSTPLPGNGTLQVSVGTTGADLDSDGYTAALDNAGARALPVNGTISISNVAAGTHTVTLNGLASNCTVAENPRTVTVSAGQTTAAAFAVTCTATGASTGQLRVTAATSGSSRDPDGYAVSVDGGAAQTLEINGSRTISGLSAGAHSVTLSGLAANCAAENGLQRSTTVTAGQTAVVAFTVSCAATGSSVNLRIERMYLTQSTQTGDGNVPLVQGREAYVRVFVTASGSNSVRPPVRLRFFQNGGSAPAQTLTIQSEGSSTPTTVQEGALGSSWNIRVPASLIQPNTAVLAEVDPENAVAESNEGDNSFPASGTPRQLSVRSVPPVSVRFVPIQQAANGLTGVVRDPESLMDLARRIHPLNEIRTSVHATYTTTTDLPLEGSDENEAWERVLEELDAMRLIEGSDQHYFGMVRVNYGAGVNGIGYVGVPSAIGSDDPGEVTQVVAHELGHNWGRWHSPCGNPGGLDPDERYPYSNGSIGVFGLDVGRARLRPPSDPDIMGYCPNPWISDYTFNKVLGFRAAAAFGTGASAGARQPSMIIWGRVQKGRLVLEPAFQVVTRPSLPARPGPYTVEATAADGTRLFSFSFDANQIPDKATGNRAFAFAVPLDPSLASRMTALRLKGPGAQPALLVQSRGDLRRGVSADAVTSRREGDGITLKWDAGAHPMIVVRDPDSGEVLSIARNGRARIPTAKTQLDLEVSDGVRSYGFRRAISR